MGMKGKDALKHNYWRKATDAVPERPYHKTEKMSIAVSTNSAIPISK
jgi:hypothetical protein